MDVQSRATKHGARRHHAHAKIDARRLTPLLEAAKNGGITVRAQALLVGACQNMKKMARLLARAAARLLRRIWPRQAAMGLFQHRLRDLAAGFMLQATIRRI